MLQDAVGRFSCDAEDVVQVLAERWLDAIDPQQPPNEEVEHRVWLLILPPEAM